MKQPSVILILAILAFFISACVAPAMDSSGDMMVEKPDTSMENELTTSDNNMMGKNLTVMERKDPSTEKADASSTDTAMMEKDDFSHEYSGTHFAGSTSPYLAFTQTDYEQALEEKKVIILYFYADWCPVCKAEQKETISFFDSLEREDVIGFRVNFKDSSTDADEEGLAKEFGVPYQHTKVLLKNGKLALKSLEAWKIKDYQSALESI